MKNKYVSVERRVVRTLAVMAVTALIVISSARVLLAYDYECTFDGPYVSGYDVSVNYFGYTSNPLGGVAVFYWGDGSYPDGWGSGQNASGTATHTYSGPGTYTVTMHFGPCQYSQNAVIN